MICQNVNAPPRRLLLIDESPQSNSASAGLLGAAGFVVQSLHDPTRAVEVAANFAPHLILTQSHMRALSGAEVASSLRGNRATAAIPVVFLARDTSIEQLVRAIRSGAVELLGQPLDALQFECLEALWRDLSAGGRTGAIAPGRSARDLLASFRRHGHTGTLTVNPGTPFEGRAVFAKGELRWAQLGPATGFPALEEMLLHDQGAWRFHQEADSPRPVAEPVARYSPRVLLVDDEPALLRMFRAVLSNAGMQVSTAADGVQALEVTQSIPFELAIADLNMPRLDGWGLLRALKAAHATREIPVCFLSVQDDYRETLQAARAGAQEYLSKTEPAEELLRRIEALMAPRKQAYETVASSQPLQVDLSRVGPQWMLRAFAQLRVSGQLEAQDDWGQYSVLIDDGRLAEVTLRIGHKLARGVPALAALLVARELKAEFSPGQMANLGKRQGIDEVLAHTCAALDAIEEQVTARRLREDTSLVVDENLYELFFRVGNTRELVLARALCEQKISPAKLASHLGMPPEEVEAGLKELLRRQVLSFR